MDTKWYEFTDGIFGLVLVDKEAEGYADSWMAPSGLTADQVTLEAYNQPEGWHCQLTAGKLTPRSATTTRNRPATFCNAASQTATPVESSWTLDASWAQDNQVSDGVSRYTFEHDAKEAYFVLGLGASGPPIAIGRCYIAAGEFGGTAGTDLVTTVSMQLPRKPSIEFGDNAQSEVVD